MARKPVHFRDGIKAKATIDDKGKIFSIGDFKCNGKPIPISFIPFDIYQTVQSMLGGEWLSPTHFKEKVGG